MGQGKLSRYLGTFLFVCAIGSMVGFWWARTTQSSTALYWMTAVKWTVLTLGACILYMAAVGIYHTILAILGLDGEPGLFSKGGRSGPFSGPPVDARHAQVVEGAGVIPEPPAAPRPAPPPSE